MDRFSPTLSSSGLGHRPFTAVTRVRIPLGSRSASTTYVKSADLHDSCMTKHAAAPTPKTAPVDLHDNCMTKNAGVKKVTNESKIRNVQSGSVIVRIYEGRNRGKPFFTVIWYVGERRMRKGFFELQEAKTFAKDQAEKLAAGQVNSPSVTVAEAQEMKEALRRLGPIQIPIHVVAGEYADVVKQLGRTGTLRQAVEFFLHNSIRPDMQRTVGQMPYGVRITACRRRQDPLRRSPALQLVPARPACARGAWQRFQSPRRNSDRRVHTDRTLGPRASGSGP